MYARSFSFKVSPNQRSEVEAIADRAFSLMKSQKGFVSVHFIVSGDEGAYGSFSLWELKTDAEAVGEPIRLELGEALAKLAIEPPKLEIFEVYKPKG